MRLDSTLAAAALVVATLVAASQPASAKKAFAKKEDVECSKCHVNPKGGGARNLVGSYYQVKKELPKDETDPQVQRTVDEWMDGLMAVPPVITWRYTPLSELREVAPPVYERAPDHDVLRRMSLDLRGTVPSTVEVGQLLREERTLDDFLESFLQSREFEDTFRLYHMDLVRPRTGDYNQPASYTQLDVVDVGDARSPKRAWRSTKLDDDDCSPGALVQVSPYFDRKTPAWACKGTAALAATVDVGGKQLRCDSDVGQDSGACGCGPHLLFCYREVDKRAMTSSVREEMARISMEVVQHGLPYTDVLTADWTINDGKLETFYAKLAGNLADVKDPDWKKPWQRVMREPRHSGVLTTPQLNNYFYNGRRWSQRVFEAYFCHETTPDFDLLDDLDIAGHVTAVPYRDQPEQQPSITVTEGRACAACHIQLDGLSRIRDRWDVWGQYHEQDGRDRVIPESAMFLGRTVTGLDEFGRALADSEVFHDCVANQLWSHFVGHRFTPIETATRRSLVRGFQASRYDFKELVRQVVRSPEYRARTTLKLMTRELYKGSFQRILGSSWQFKTGKSGFDMFYDKVGGMDYRKIEFRDRRPGIGHSLVQYKAAAESCSSAVESDAGKGRLGRRLLNVGPANLDVAAGDRELDAVLQDWYLRMFARPIDAVPVEELDVLRGLYNDVGAQAGPLDAWKAVCTTMLASSDFSVF